MIENDQVVCSEDDLREEQQMPLTSCLDSPHDQFSYWNSI